MGWRGAVPAGVGGTLAGLDELDEWERDRVIL